MKSILIALAVLVIATPALAGNGGYKKPKPNHGYHHGKQWNGHGNNNWNNRGNNNRYYNNHNTYNYKYGGGNNNGWYAFGGFLGGLAVGGAIAEPGYGGGAYYYDQPGAQCTTIFKRVWNDVYQEWENIPRTVCGGY